MLRFLILLIFCNLLFPVSISYATEVIDKTPNNILIYHRFNDNRFPSTNTTIQQFEDQIDYLITNNYKFVTLHQLVNDPDMKDKSIAITIDDAYQSFYQFGFPVLKKYNISATLFLSTESVGSSDFLNWTQLRELLNYGIDIQNHTHTHSHMPDQTLVEIEKFIVQYNIGIIIEDITPEGIASSIMAFKENHELQQQLEENCIAAAKNENWLFEKLKLIEAIKE